MTTLSGHGATDVGRVRSHNEDQYLTEESKHLYAVADGVGGHKAGEVASQTAVETLRSAFEEPTTDGLVEAVKQANRTVWNLAESNSEQRGMGTTLTAIALVRAGEGDEGGGSPDRLAVVNVGDSRAYLLQNGELEQLTEDHSLVEQMVRQGQLTPEEAQVHPQRSIITRALGLDPEVEVDSWELIPYQGDRLLLCSDGLTNEVNDEQIASTLRSVSDPEDAAHQLVTQARNNGGNDNITCVVVDVLDDDNRAEEASAALAAEPVAPRSARATQDAPPDGDGQRAGAATAPRRPPAEEREPRPRRMTWRVVVFIVALLAILAVAVVAVGWYARHTYYVGLDKQGQVAIFKGRPGGLLWFDPTLYRTTTLRENDVLRSRVPDLRAGKAEPSLADAQRYVNNLRQEAAARAQPATPATPATPAPVETVVPPTSIPA